MAPAEPGMPDSASTPDSPASMAATTTSSHGVPAATVIVTDGPGDHPALVAARALGIEVVLCDPPEREQDPAASDQHTVDNEEQEA